MRYRSSSGGTRNDRIVRLVVVLFITSGMSIVCGSSGLQTSPLSVEASRAIDNHHISTRCVSFAACLTLAADVRTLVNECYGDMACINYVI